jgi:hypothetical protein
MLSHFYLIQLFPDTWSLKPFEMIYYMHNESVGDFCCTLYLNIYFYLGLYSLHKWPTEFGLESDQLEIRERNWETC